MTQQTISRPPERRTQPRHPKVHGREKFHFTADLYLEMTERSFFSDSAPLELIRGEIFTMPALEMDHATCLAQLIALCTARLHDRAYLWPQMPIRAADSSVPEPDLALVTRRKYRRGKPPTAADIFLMVEIASTSLRVDSTVKSNSMPKVAFKSIGSSIYERGS